MRKLITIASFILISLSTTAWAVDCPIPDTGQTECYDDNTQEITCPQPGEDFYGQDAQYLCNPQSYTKLDENGNDLPDTATYWTMVRDNVTGLIWEVKQEKDDMQNYANHHDADNEYTWYDSNPATNGGDPGTPGDGTDTEDFINALNAANFGGYDDWRLPTFKELSFIRNMDTYIPAIDTDYFPNTMSFLYWSSTSLISTTNFAWQFHFHYGTTLNRRKSIGGYVRAVRGGQSSQNFVDNGNGTVTDTSTGLMWELKTDDGGIRDKDNEYTWEEALSYCGNLTLGGYDDWRLPDLNELQSIVDNSRYNPAIDPIFSYTMTGPSYWPSTSYVYHPNQAWNVNFYEGSIGVNAKYNDSYVRAVRGGQCRSFDTSTTTTADSTTSTISDSTTSTIDGNTTTTTTAEECPSEEIYGEDSAETELLRYLRDNVLNQTPAGQELIKLYYQWSPVIVQAMVNDEEFKEQVKEMLDGVLELMGQQQISSKFLH